MLPVGAMDILSEQGLLGVLAAFDQLGGTSVGLAAWELFTTEQAIADAWNDAHARGWLYPAARDDVYGEQLWRLTDSGWAAARTRTRS